MSCDALSHPTEAYTSLGSRYDSEPFSKNLDELRAAVLDGIGAVGCHDIT